jgi:hypothetical protein
MEPLVEYLNTYTLSVLEYLDAPLVYSFIFSNPSFYHPVLVDGFLKSSLSFVHHLISLLNDLSSISYYLLIYSLKILFVLFPYFISISQTIIEFHQTQLRTSDLIIEMIVLSLLILYLLFRQSILKAWKALMTSLSKKYQDVARVAPHLLFFFSAALLAIFGRKFLIPLSSPRVLPLFTLVRPLFRSFQLWKASDPSLKSQQDQVVLWTVLGSYFALSAFASMIPFSQYFLSFIPALGEFSLVVSLSVSYCSRAFSLCLLTLCPPLSLRLSHSPTLNSDRYLDPILASLCQFGF